MAHNPRVYDRESGEWVDGDPAFVNVKVWGPQAEHVEASFSKGARALVTGPLKTQRYEDDDGNPRTWTFVEADEVGASLLFTAVGRPAE